MDKLLGFGLDVEQLGVSFESNMLETWSTFRERVHLKAEEVILLRMCKPGMAVRGFHCIGIR